MVYELKGQTVFALMRVILLFSTYSNVFKGLIMDRCIMLTSIQLPNVLSRRTGRSRWRKRRLHVSLSHFTIWWWHHSNVRYVLWDMAVVASAHEKWYLTHYILISFRILLTDGQVKNKWLNFIKCQWATKSCLSTPQLNRELLWVYLFDLTRQMFVRLCKSLLPLLISCEATFVSHTVSSKWFTALTTMGYTRTLLE